MDNYNTVGTSPNKYKIFVTPECLVIKHYDYDKFLHFDYLNDYACKEVTKDDLSSITFNEHKYRPHAILGIFQIDKWTLLLFVSEYEEVGLINDKQIFTIKEIDYISLSSESFVVSTDVRDYLTGIQALMMTGFYYSFDYDLTLSTQTQKTPKPDSLHLKESLYYHINYDLKSRFLLNKINPIFYVNLIYGYVGISNTIDLKGDEISIVLISRRSRFMAGTLFNTKGIDEDGNTANFVETEQIMTISRKTFSFVIYRGSPPLFLKNNKGNLTDPIEIVEKEKDTLSFALSKHIERLTTKEKFNLIFVNLLSDTIKEEAAINKNLNNNFFPKQTLEGNICKHLNFDIVNSMNSNFELLETFATGVIKSCDIYYFFEDSKFKETLEQKGVIRVHCLSCLDRTNIMQATICWKILGKQVRNNN